MTGETSAMKNGIKALTAVSPMRVGRWVSPGWPAGSEDVLLSDGPCALHLRRTPPIGSTLRVHGREFAMLQWAGDNRALPVISGLHPAVEKQLFRHFVWSILNHRNW